jgi:hypothetical protein
MQSSVGSLDDPLELLQCEVRVELRPVFCVMEVG